MERRWLCDNKPILAKSTLHAFEEGETEAIILRDWDLEQSDIDVICENFAYATYVDLSHNKKIAHIKFLLTPTTLYLRDCTSLHDIQYRFTSCTLKNLDLAGCPIDYEEHLTKYDFPVLENLTLSWKPGVSWIKLFAALKALKSVNLQGIYRKRLESLSACESGGDLKEFLTALAHAKNIKEITFGGIPSEVDISTLKNITEKKLKFQISKDVAANHLQRLYNLHSLYAVYLEHADLVTDIDLLQLIESCPNLSKITLDYCHSVTKNFVFNAAEFLRERDKDQPLKARLNLEMCGCAGITEDIQADPLYAKAESAMSLILFFKCKYPTSTYRNDLIIPYPPPNVQLSIYILFEIYRKLIQGPAAQRFATVCEDFENAAIEEERHLKIIACRKAKIVNNDTYDAYLEITTEDSEFFKTLQCENATKMELSNRIITFDTIFDDFPSLKRLKLLNCVLYEEELPKHKSYTNISDLEIFGGNAFRLWQALAVLLPNIETVNLADALLENPLNGTKVEKPFRFGGGNPFGSLTRLTIIGSIIKDEDVEFLRHLRNLKTLAILWNSQITGKYLSELRSIAELKLKCCENLKQYYLADMLHALPLKSLDIRGSSRVFVSTQLTNEMWLSCETLKALKMNWHNEHTITTIRILQTLEDIEVRNFQALTCVACQRTVAPATANDNLTSEDVACTCLEQTQLEQRFFRALINRTHITRLTLDTELLSRNLNFLQLLQRVTQLSVIAKRSELDVFRIAPNFYRTIGQLANLEYLHFTRFSYCYDGVIHIVGRCAKLKEIRLKECVGFSDVVVYDLSDVLRRRRTKDQLPLCLYMLNANDNSSDSYSETCSSRVAGEVNRFEDIQEFIKVIFM